ncbi:hypothetical protein Tco_0115059 [Tanacetum coccineum]
MEEGVKWINTKGQKTKSKMTKQRMGMEKTGKIRPNAKCQVIVNTEESAVNTGAELKNTIEYKLYPSDGPGKPK